MWQIIAQTLWSMTGEREGLDFTVAKGEHFIG
jgi:hypothetical protein